MAEKSTEAAREATLADAEATRAGAASVLEDSKAVKRGQYIFAGLTILLILTVIIFVITGHPTPALVAGIAGFITGLGAMITPVNQERWRPVTTTSDNEI